MKTKFSKSFMTRLISLILVFAITLPTLLFSIPQITAEATTGSSEGSTDNTNDHLDGYVAEGLVSFYSGTHNTRNGHDKSSKVWEDLVGTNDMTLTGGYFTDEGYYSNASYSMLPSGAASVLKGNAFTMEMYVSDFEPLGTVNDETGRLFYNVAQNFRLSYMSSADQIRFTYATGKHAYIDNGLEILQDAHIAITYNDDGSVHLYINGVEAFASAAGSVSASPVTEDSIYISSAFSKAKVNVTIEQIRLYSRALESTEIKTNYRNDLKSLIDNLVDNSGYVTDGLTSWYNGSQNGLKGHNLEATVWNDLVSGYDMTVANNENSYFEEDGGYRTNLSRALFSDEVVEVARGNAFTIELLLSDFIKNEDTNTYRYSRIISDADDNFDIFVKNYQGADTLSIKYPGLDAITFVNGATEELQDMLISITYVAGDSCSVYVDGKLELVTSAPDHLNIADLGIGHASSRYTSNIAYDQIRIYDRELSDEEIARNASVDGKIVYVEDGLEALYVGSRYTLDEGGTTATWNDLMGKYDMTGVIIDENNYFAGGGYRLTSAQNFFPVELLDVIQTKSEDSTFVDGTVHKSYTVEMLVKDFVPTGTAEATYQRILASTNDRFCIFRNTEGNILKFKQESERMSIDEGASKILENALITITYDYDESTGLGLGIMYVNGVMITSKSYGKNTAENRPAPTDLFIGYPAAKASTYAYELTYRSMRFYGRALTADEVTHNAKIDGIMSRELLGYIEPTQPKTNVIGDVALTREINSLAELEAMMAADALPSSAIYTVDSSLNVLDESGAAFATFDEVLSMTDYSVLPILIPVDSAAAEAIVQYSTETGFSDLTVLTSDKELLKTTRESKTNLRGALNLCDEYAGVSELTHEDRVNVRKAAKKYMATFVVLPLSILTNDDLKHFYDMQVSVWAVCSDDPTDEECYKALLSGAMGIVTDDTAKMLDIGCNEIPENTMVRAPMNIGHAGIPKIAPTDVLESFRLAVESGADCLEIDLQITADGEIVSIHDLDTIRTCADPEDPEANYVVAETTFEKLRTLKANKGFEDDPRFDNCYIPTLREILDEFADTDVRFLFEMKRSDPSLGRRTVEYIHEYGIYDRSTIHSFFPDILAEARATDEAISLNYVRTNLLLDEIDSDYDMKGVMNLIGELNATYMLSIVNGSGVKSQRAAYLRGVQLYPYSFKNAAAYANHYLWGYGGLTGDDSRGLAEVVRLYTANVDKTLTVGESADLTMTLGNYLKAVSTVSPSVIKVISGEELISLSGNTLTALGAGEVTLALGYTGTVGGKSVNYFDDPVTITIAEKASEAVEPGIKILASNLEYADFLHILYAVSVNAPEGATVSDVKMLFWDEAQIAYTKENAKIIKSAYTSTSITMGGITYDNCSLIRSADIAPKEICDDIYAVAYVTIDGVDYYSKVLRYSPLTYVYSRLYTLDNTTPTTEAEIATAENQRHLYETILKYGAAAQKIFGYTENGLATDGYVFVSVKGGRLDDGFTTDVLALGETVTLIANDTNGFAGWVDEDGNILSTEATYTFTPDRSIVITASYLTN